MASGSPEFVMFLQYYDSSPNFISVMPLRMIQCCQHCQLSIDKLKINWRSILVCLTRYFETNFQWKVRLKILNSGIHPFVFVLNNFSIFSGVFIALGLSGVIPALHFVITDGFWYAIDRASLGWLSLMAVLYIVGAVIYAARIPERLFPGKFDIWVSIDLFQFFLLLSIHCLLLLPLFTVN